jgi:hypothetical protein
MTDITDRGIEPIDPENKKLDEAKAEKTKKTSTPGRKPAHEKTDYDKGGAKEFPSEEIKEAGIKSKRDPIDTKVFSPEETREALRESREAFDKEKKNQKSGL